MYYLSQRNDLALPIFKSEQSYHDFHAVKRSIFAGERVWLNVDNSKFKFQNHKISTCF